MSDCPIAVLGGGNGAHMMAVDSEETLAGVVPSQLSIAMSHETRITDTICVGGNA